MVGQVTVSVDRRCKGGGRPRPLAEVDAWLGRFGCFWVPPLDTFPSKLARGEEGDVPWTEMRLPADPEATPPVRRGRYLDRLSQTSVRASA